MKSHRETYPEQYRHPLVGQLVNVVTKPNGEVIAQGRVERVVTSQRWGQLAHLEGGGNTFYSVAHCKPQPTA